jgi:hypothetical protein
VSAGPYVPAPTAAAPELAWSLHDNDTETVERESWSLAWGHASVVLSIAAVVALVTVIVGWTIMRSGRDPQPLAGAGESDNTDDDRHRDELFYRRDDAIPGLSAHLYAQFGAVDESL